MLIPEEESLPHNEQIYVTSFYKPHFEVGGDYYDFIRLNDEEDGFCIADVSGKGMSAALLMSNFQANLRALFTTSSDLEDIIHKLNDRVMASAKGEKFITMFIAKYNYNKKTLEYITSAHNPPLLYKVDSKQLQFLQSGCLGLGMLEEIPHVEKGVVKIDERTKLFCYTDGLVEMIDEGGVNYDTEQIRSQISNNDRIDENIDAIIKSQGIQEGSKAIFDDISMIWIEFTH